MSVVVATDGAEVRVGEVGVDALPALAALHAQAFDAPWSEAAFADLLGQAGVFALAAGDQGFILCRVVADEAEILTLAVRPEARRRGVGRVLVGAASATARGSGAERLFLEVAHDNASALALYRSVGFTEVGRRRAYYPRSDGTAADALVLAQKPGPENPGLG